MTAFQCGEGPQFVLQPTLVCCWLWSNDQQQANSLFLVAAGHIEPNLVTTRNIALQKLSLIPSLVQSDLCIFIFNGLYYS